MYTNNRIFILTVRHKKQSYLWLLSTFIELLGTSRSKRKESTKTKKLHSSYTLSGQNSLKKARSNSFSCKCFSCSIIFRIFLDSFLVLLGTFSSCKLEQGKYKLYALRVKDERHVCIRHYQLLLCEYGPKKKKKKTFLMFPESVA